MAERFLIVGAGILGASIAYQLSARGVDVTVVDQGLPAGGASGSSFGWINANFAETPEYYTLRRNAIEAFHQLSETLDLSDAIRWTGSLWWEEAGDALAAHLATLKAYGYAADRIDAAQFAALEPAVAHPPAESILAQVEGGANGAHVTRKLLTAAAGQGAKVIPGCAIKRLVLQGGRVTGVETAIGQLSADQIVIAAGAGTTQLLADADIHLPVDVHAGVILQTLPVAQVLNHMILSPDVHAHQLSDGSLLVGEIFSGGAPTEVLAQDPGGFARDILGRLEARVPALKGLSLAQCRIGHRPVPQGGFPAIGAIPQLDNAYVAVTHSGVTLAALIGQLAAKELLDGANSPQLDSFRPCRFKETTESMS